MHNIRFTGRKIAQRLALVERFVYRRRHPLPPFRFAQLDSPLDEPPVGVDVDYSVWPVIEPGSYWAGRDTNFVLRGTFAVPADWDPMLPVALYLPLGVAGDFSHPEALAYIDGQPYATCDRHHQEFQLADVWRGGSEHQLALHGWTGIRVDLPDTRLQMSHCEVVQIDQPTRDFVVLARTALGVADIIDDNDPVQTRLLNALDEAFKLLDLREPQGAAFYDTLPLAHHVLEDAITQAGAPLDVDIVGTGHAHIDVAWLWTLGQTRRKAGRTFHTVLRLMEQFPEYHFTQSQPQLYDYVRQDYPALFDAIRQRVAEGRWELIGGMWVEADCNLSGPESLARQFLLGRRFFEQQFGEGVESPVLWLPDVFGYAWNLPQLIREAGLEYFFTIKIGWNQYNRLPYDSFWWQGLDGTRVLTHFSTTPPPDRLTSNATYNAEPEPGSVIHTWRNFQQKEAQQEILMAFGFGDGGGGPTREMLENIRAMNSFPSTPRVRNGSAGDFFRRLQATAGDHLPVWDGELYLELHRGTYTTQSRNKRANRQSEFLLHDAEALAVLASLLDPAYAYPAETINRAWELVCLNQFHDIIPGSSITDVYTESQQQYAEVRQLAEQVRGGAMAIIAQEAGGDVLVANTSGFTRSDPVLWPGQLEAGEALVDEHGVPLMTQTTARGTWIAPVDLPPFTVQALRRQPGSAPQPADPVIAEIGLLENAYLRVEFDEAGDICRIFDKTRERDVLPPGTVANQMQAFEDRPMNWDAWDIDIFYDDKQWLAEPATSVRVIEAGPVRAALEIERRILNSSYTQRVSLAYNSARLDIETVIDWHERHVLLKAAFPVDVLSPSATYEIQWGNTERPAHRNTSWDWARFETCAQKWIDLSEGDYGVSLLNDCKYGHDIHGNVMRVSLLRSPTSPDPYADQGQHRFTLSLYPHEGRWGAATIREAYALNAPLLAVDGTGEAGALVIDQGALTVDRENVVIETVKRAEDSDTIIVRLYETHRRRGPITLMTGFPLASAHRVDILERDRFELAVADGNNITFDIRPYEIITLRLVPAQE